MASPDSQPTDSHPGSSTLCRGLNPSSHLNHDELPPGPSFLSLEARHNSLGFDSTGTLAQSSPSATSNPSVVTLPHLSLGVAKSEKDFENPISSSPVVSLASCPSRANSVKYVSAGAPIRQIPFDSDAAGSEDSLEFDHLTRRLVTTYFIYFLCGWGDGVTATVLPAFKNDFNLSYLTTSLLFVSTTFGCLLGTVLLERFVKFLGRFYPTLDRSTYLPALPFFHRLFTKNPPGTLPRGVGYSPAKARFSSLLLAALLHPLFFIMMGTALNYPEIILAYAISSLARSFWTGSSNFYVASTPKKPLGVLLGWWSMGSFSAPLVCQTLLAKGIPWRNFYLGSLVLSAIALSLILFNFRPTHKEFLADRKAALDAMQFTGSALSSGTMVDLKSSEKDKISDFSADCLDAPSPPNTLLRALSIPYQWAFIVFIFIYGGSETVFQGYIVSYLLAERNFDPNTVGYVSSGFWGGMGVGRLLWGYYCTGLTFAQRKHIIHICIGVSFSMTMLIWFVQSAIENAISSAVVGLAFGPIFAGTIGLCNDVLPSEVRMVSMAIISAASSLGSAILPFLAGSISKIDGMKVFSYVTVAETVAMFSLWVFFPSSPPVRVSGPA